MKGDVGAAADVRTPNLVQRWSRTALVAGGMAIGGTVFVGMVTVAEGWWAWERQLPAQIPPVPARSGLFGSEHGGTPLDLAMLGDSLAVGVGAESPDQTIGVLLANGLASASGRPVLLRNVAVVGSESKDLAAQIAALTERSAHLGVVVIVVGGNEIMRLQNVAAAVRSLSEAVRQLRKLGGEIIVATCPDMGTVRPFAQPLRFFAHWLSRLLATAQTIVVLRAGGRTVSLADTIGPLFRQEPALMFSADHIHPSSEGHARAAEVLLPSVCAAAGYQTSKLASVPRRIYSKNVRSPVVVWFAFRASRRAGIEATSVPARGQLLIEIGRRTLRRLHGVVPRAPART